MQHRDVIGHSLDFVNEMRRRQNGSPFVSNRANNC
jgi:hypothetical protein